MSLPSGKKLLLFGFIAVLLIVIPLTVYLVQQQQKTQSSAQRSTTLGFNPAAKPVAIGETVDLDVMMNPGTNQVSFVKLIIKYDPTKLATTTAGLVPNVAVFPSVLQGPTYAADTISVTLSIGQNTQNIITANTKIATISFKVIATNPGTTQVTIDNTQTQAQVLSTAPTDTFKENVLSSVSPATITITAAPVLNCTLAANPITIKSTSQGTGNTSNLVADCPGENTTFISSNTYEWSTTCGTLSSTGADATKDNTLTAPPSGGTTCKVTVNVCNSNYTTCSTPTADVVIAADPSPSATAQPTASPSPTPTATPNAQAPVCQSLTLNAATTGIAPYPLTFTATGTSSASTISKVTFNFGDSAIQDVPQSNTPNSVSVQTSHTYSSLGTFTATASLTDALGNVSGTASCTQTITVTAAIAQATSTPTPSLPPTGPDGKIFTIGAIGTILSIVGVLLFFAL